GGARGGDAVVARRPCAAPRAGGEGPRRLARAVERGCVPARVLRRHRGSTEGGGVTLVLTYHAVEEGTAPLCISPRLFAEHAAVIAAAGVPVLTVSELASALSAGELPPRAVAITFDDGCASVAEHAAPALAEHGLRATVFCVAGHLGGTNEWRTQAS